MVTDERRDNFRQRGAVDWRAAIWAGIIAGIIFMVLEMIMVPVFGGGSPWGPPRMIAAIGMGRDVLPSPDTPPTFDFLVLMVAMILHLLLSVIYSVVLAFFIHRLDMGRAAVLGAAFGLALYLINFYAFTALFPWFANARNWITIFTHIVFGLVAAAAYKGLQKPKGEVQVT